MNILCLTYEYPPIGGGGANVAHPLARHLVAQGNSVDVVTSGMPCVARMEQIEGVNVHRTRCWRKHRHYTTTTELLTYLWPTYRKALQLCRERPFDINHTHFALPSGIVSYLLYKRTGLPYVTTIHGSDVPGYNPDRFRVAHALARPLWRRIVGNSAKVVSASEFLKGLIQEHIDVPVEVVRNGYERDPDMRADAPKANRILIVTRMFQRKGVQHLVAALSGLDHGWEVVVAGDGPYLPKIEARAKELDVDIRFVGFVQGRELLELYETSKIFVFPSLQENFPVVLLEAMQAGCAIITTNAEGCAEVIGDAGIVVEPGRPDQIRNALVELMESEQRMAGLAAAARRRIEIFRWPKIAGQYDSLLRDAGLTSAPVSKLAPGRIHTQD